MNRRVDNEYELLIFLDSLCVRELRVLKEENLQENHLTKFVKNDRNWLKIFSVFFFTWKEVTQLICHLWLGRYFLKIIEFNWITSIRSKVRLRFRKLINNALKLELHFAGLGLCVFLFYFFLFVMRMIYEY